MPSNLPPGVTQRMIEAAYGEDSPCAICGLWPDDCVCPECPVCGTFGDSSCYSPSTLHDCGRNHDQVMTDVQCLYNAFLLASTEEERRYDQWVDEQLAEEYAP